MGVVYHARYLVWLDVARTEHLRRSGVSYADLEAMGLRLAMGDVAMRFKLPARYDDRIRVHCWVRDLASRRVTFGYAVYNGDSGALLATAVTSLLVLDAAFKWARLPEAVHSHLVAIPDPVRVG
jgi:acyl-CoA thioester hydrolase